MPQLRDQDARRRILTAVQELVELKGPSQATVSEIAQRAGVGRQTIYRWWRTRSLLAIEALCDMTDKQIQFSDTGRFEADLYRQVERLADAFAGPIGALLKEIVADSLVDGEVAAAFRMAYFERRRDRARATVQRGIDLGVIRPDADLDAVVYSIYGPIYLALLVGHVPITRQLAQQAVTTTIETQRPDDATSPHPRTPNRLHRGSD